MSKHRAGWLTRLRLKTRDSKSTLSDTSTYPPVIYTPEGPVTEWARRQAAENMRLNPAKKIEVEKLIGETESRRRYPEAYDAD